MECGVVDGLFVAVFVAFMASYCVAVGEIPSRWPFNPIRSSESPRKFWGIIGMWYVVSLCGLAYAIMFAGR